METTSGNNYLNTFNVGSSSTLIYGECRGYKCPVCDEITKKIGDLNNPVVDIHGELMCDDCKVKLRKLIGK